MLLSACGCNVGPSWLRLWQGGSYENISANTTGISYPQDLERILEQALNPKPRVRILRLDSSIGTGAACFLQFHS